MTDVDVYDALPEAVVVLDTAHRIRGFNDRAAVLLALAPEAVGQPLSDGLRVVDDSGADATASLTPPRGIAERLAERVLRLVLADGRLRPVAVAGRHVDDGLVLTFRSAARRERVDAARSDLISTVSHEIRSPLTSVKGFTRTMLARWDRFSDEQKRTMLATIDEDADRVTRLLTELLDVSRIDAGRVQLHRQPVDLARLARRVADREPDGDGGPARPIHLEVADGLPPVHGDPDKLEQVLINLVDNALRYAGDSPVWIRLAAAEDDVHVQVADQGPGVPADQHTRIFEKFGRARGQRGSGTGLGLYISRGLVRAHGGSVWIESDAGAGATFHLRLPRSGTARGVQ